MSGQVYARKVRVADLKEVLAAARKHVKRAVYADARYKRHPWVRCGECYTHLEKDGVKSPHRPTCPVPQWERAIELLSKAVPQ